MARKIALMALLTVCVLFVSASPTSAQYVVHYTGDCTDFDVAVSGNPVSTICGASITWFVGSYVPWNIFRGATQRASTTPFACPSPNNAYHLAEVWRPTSGVARLQARSYIDGYGPIIRRNGYITVNGNQGTVVTPFLPGNCWLQ